MNISKGKEIVDDDEDDEHDEHMNKNKNINHHDMVSSSRCHNIVGDDLITEILLRLLTIAVYRFRRVCKQWYSLISNPDFLRAHSSSFSTNDQLLVCKSKSNLRPCNGYVEILHVTDNQLDDDDYNHQKPRLVHELSLPVNLSSYHLIDSCNGLLLLRCIVVPDTIKNDNSMYEDITSCNTYYVCNPMTNNYLKLPGLIPIPNIQADEKLLAENLIHSRHASLVFDPSISLSYKVIRYLLRESSRRDIDRHWQIYVYSSETGSWKLLTARIPDPMGTVELGLRSVLLNGVLYWSYWMTTGDNSVCFDVEKEFVWFLALPRKPEGFDGMRNCLYFGECGGRLRLIERFVDSDEKGWIDSLNRLPRSFHVMEAEPQRYEQRFQAPYYTWTVKYCVDIGWVYDRRPSVIHCYKTKNRRGTKEELEEEEDDDDEAEEVLLLKLNDRTIASFNLTSMKFKSELIAIPESICLSDFVDVFAYKRTLFPVS